MENTTYYKGYEIEIYTDEDAQNPLTAWDGNPLYCLSHRRYDLHNDTDIDTGDFEGWQEVKAEIIEQYEPIAILPVFMYDHSGITIKTSPFNCRWDSGQIGYVFLDMETYKSWGNTNGDHGQKELDQMLIDSVQVYDDYLTGNVFGYSVKDAHGEDMDSCTGYFGDEGLKMAQEEAQSIINHMVKRNSVKHFSKLKGYIKSKVNFSHRQPFDMAM